MRHTRIHSRELERCLAVINRALQQIRRNPTVSLFAFDEDGRCYIHQETHRNVSRLWQEFLASQMQGSFGREVDVTQGPVAPQPLAAPHDEAQSQVG